MSQFAQRLKNIIDFVIPAGGVVTLPHELAWPDRRVVPDIITPSAIVNNVVFTADDVNVIGTNNEPQEVTVSVLVESWHTIERSFGDAANTSLVPQPFIVGGDGDIGVTTIDFGFKPFDPAGPRGFIYTDWNLLYPAMRDAVRKGFMVILAWDTSYCPFYQMLPGASTPTGAQVRAFTMPEGTWDMRDIFWENNEPDVTVVFPGRCFMEGAGLCLGGFRFALINDSLYTTPFIIGGPSPLGGTRPQMTTNAKGGRYDVFNTMPGVKPMVKLGGSQAMVVIGIGVFTSWGARQYLGNNNLPAPVIDIGGNSLFAGNLNIENNAFTSLAGAIALGPSTTLTAPVSPGDTVINVVSTAAFDATGVIDLNNRSYGEPFTYTSKTATSFTGVVPVTGGYAGPTGIIPGAPVTAQFAVKAGDMTINVAAGTAAGFPASGTLRVNGNLELIGYSAIVGNSFTLTAPVIGNYKTGTLFEPIRAVSTTALAVGALAIPVDSTAGFPAAGTLFLYQNGVSETITYTGITATSFTSGVGMNVNAYANGAIMERASSFRGGSITPIQHQPIAFSGRFGTMEWQMPNLDLSTATVVPSQLNGIGMSYRDKKAIKSAGSINVAPFTMGAQLTTVAVVPGGTTLTVASTAGFPTVGYLVLGGGSESVQYTGKNATQFTGCTPFIKAHPIGTSAIYGVMFGEAMLLNASVPVVVQLPDARRSFGELITIKEFAGGAAGISVFPFATQTIDGGAAGVSAPIAGAFGVMRLMSSGLGGWLLI